jgi:hypothetical protein
MKAAYIASALGEARREGHAWRCRCPLHGGRSLIIREGDRGRVLATCWGGCERGEVLAELHRLDLLDGGPNADPGGQRRLGRDDDGRSHGARRIARALAIWRHSVAAPDIIARYLAGRGIALAPMPGSLRWHPSCPHPYHEPMPAMVAVVEHVECGIVGIHRTYLTPEHHRHDRAALGSIGGGAVRLGAPRANGWLAIAEGIETTLAVLVSCAMPAWAALSAGGIRALMLPPEATHVIICADHDASGTGKRAAHDAAARWLAEGRRVRIAIPPRSDTDFNDVLTGRAAANIIEACHVA